MLTTLLPPSVPTFKKRSTLALPYGNVGITGAPALLYNVVKFLLAMELSVIGTGNTDTFTLFPPPPYNDVKLFDDTLLAICLLYVILTILSWLPYTS